MVWRILARCPKPSLCSWHQGSEKVSVIKGRWEHLQQNRLNCIPSVLGSTSWVRMGIGIKWKQKACLLHEWVVRGHRVLVARWTLLLCLLFSTNCPCVGRHGWALQSLYLIALFVVPRGLQVTAASFLSIVQYRFLQRLLGPCLWAAEGPWWAELPQAVAGAKMLCEWGGTGEFSWEASSPRSGPGSAKGLMLFLRGLLSNFEGENLKIIFEEEVAGEHRASDKGQVGWCGTLGGMKWTNYSFSLWPPRNWQCYLQPLYFPSQCFPVMISPR